MVKPRTSSSSGRTQLRVGRLLKAHGLKGALKLELYTDEPERRFVPGAVFSLQVPTSSPWHGKTIEFSELRWYNTHPVGFFRDVSDRDTAESLVKAILWIDQDAAELPDEDDAWYDHQLVGLDVYRDGERIGMVARVDHLPAQDLLAVKTAVDEVLVPFVKDLVPSVDLAARRVVVTPPPGLFEVLPDDDPEPVPEPAGAGAAADAGEPAADVHGEPADNAGAGRAAGAPDPSRDPGPEQEPADDGSA